MSQQFTRSEAAAIIPLGGSATPSIDLGMATLAGFVMPASWDAAGITIEVSYDGTRWSTPGLFDSANAAAGVYSSVVANGFYAVDLQAFMPWSFVRFRSGTSAVPVLQTAARSITYITRPLA